MTIEFVAHVLDDRYLVYWHSFAVGEEFGLN